MASPLQETSSSTSSAYRSSLSARQLLGASSIACSGLLFALFPILRPWSDTTETAAGLAEAFTSPWWIASHLVGALALVLLPFGAIPIRDAHLASPGAAAARATLPLLCAGVGLTLLYYGAETFALPAVAGDASTILERSASIRFGAVQVTLLGVGLLCIAAGAITLAIAVWRGRILPRSSAVPLAAMIALYLPQFFAPPPVRVAHGIFTAIAALWLAGSLWRARASSPSDAPASV